MGDFISTPFPLAAGAPEGSSISPTLYTMYICDLPEPVNGYLLWNIKELHGRKDIIWNRENK